jgi:hypothetical protein
VGSETISSTREMYDSSCCLDSNFLLKASSLVLNLAASAKTSVQSRVMDNDKQLTADHVLDLVRRELTNRVGDGNVSAAAGGLLGSSDLEDTVDIDLEDDLENGITSLHRRDRSQGEFAEGGVILAVDTLSLEHGELDCLLIISHGGEGPDVKVSSC